MDAKRPILVLSDLQIPWEHSKALEFCTYLKKHYRVPNENVVGIGDETDQLNASMYDKDPDVELSAISELSLSIERLKQWADVFPEMKLCVSNHGMRWLRKATGALIPSQLIRSYQEIFKTPDKWEWRDEWRFMQMKHPVRFIHGMGYSGKDGARNAALDAQMSTVIGHLHSFAGVSHLKTMGSQRIYGMNVGCLIDEEGIAFKYGKYSRAKPCIGTGMIFNEGVMPVWIPLE